MDYPLKVRLHNGLHPCRLTGHTVRCAERGVLIEVEFLNKSTMLIPYSDYDSRPNWLVQ
jgi:hypothetical protein